MFFRLIKKVPEPPLVVCIGPGFGMIDPALSSSIQEATFVLHAFSGLVCYQQDENGALRLSPDCTTEFPTPTLLAGEKVQYVFTLKEDLKWSDGTELTAEDFEYS